LFSFLVVCGEARHGFALQNSVHEVAVDFIEFAGAVFWVDAVFVYGVPVGAFEGAPLKQIMTRVATFSIFLVASPQEYGVEPDYVLEE